MSPMGTSSVHDEWVKPIESHNQKVIAWWDKIWGNVNLVGLALFNNQAHSIVKKLKVSLFHIWGSVWANIWDQGVVGEATDESFQEVEEWEEGILDTSTELEDLETAKVKVNLGVGVVGHVKAELVKTMHEEGVEVEQFGVAEEKEVFAKKGLWVWCGDFDVEGEFSGGDILNIKIETAAGKLDGRILRGNIASIDGEKLSGVGFRIV